MGISPQPGSPAAAPIACVCGWTEVSLQAVQVLAVRSTTDRFPDKHFPLCTFDAIVFTDSSDLSAGGLGVFSNAAFAHHA